MRIKDDPTHLMITDAAKEQVADSGEFDKIQAIDKAGFGKYADKIEPLINWREVRENIEAEAGEMVPIATANSARWDPDIHPEQFLPTAGRPTTGYATATKRPEVSKLYLMRQYRTAVGMFERMERKALSFQKQGLPISYKPSALPVLELPAAAAE